MLPIELVDGFSVANARACVEASAEAYDAPPTVQSPLAHVWFQDCGNAVLIAFRGTQHAADWLTDLEAWYSPLADLVPTERMGSGRVHHGFHAALESVLDDLCDELRTRCAGRTLILTGHSLGGALAQLFAIHLTPLIPSSRPGGVHSVYTFGGPRVGNRAWAEYYDALPVGRRSDFGPRISDFPRLAGRTYRIVNQVDIIARAPGLLAGYRHTGIEVLLTPAWSLWVSPPWWLKAWADLWAVWSDVHNRRLGLLLDHHVGLYAQRIGAYAGQRLVSTNPPIHQSTNP